MLCLYTMGAVAQITSTPDATKKYTITTPTRGYLVCNSSNPDALRGDVNATDAEGSAGRYVFVPYTTPDNADHTFLYNVDLKKFIIHDASVYPSSVNYNNNSAYISATDFAVIADVSVEANTGGKKDTHPAIIKSGSFFLNLNSSGNVCLNTWSGLDDGNQLLIKEAGEFTEEELAAAKDMLDRYFVRSADVVYNIHFAGNTITKTYRIEKSLAFPTIEYPDYVTATVTSVGGVTTSTLPATVTEDVTVEVDAALNTYDSYSLLQISSSPTAADAAKFAMKNRGDAKWIYGGYNEDNTKVGDGNVSPNTAARVQNYLWTISGNWFDGYVLYNVGQQKYLTGNDPSTLGDTPAKFTLVKQSKSGHDGWGFKLGNNVLGDHESQNGTLGIWMSGSTNDDGSVHVIHAVEELEALVLPALKASIEEMASAKTDCIFGLSASDAAAFVAAKEALGESDNLEALDALYGEYSAKLIPLEEGYYQMENVRYPGEYMAYSDRLVAVTNVNDASTIVKVSSLPSGKYSLGMQSQYLQAAAGVGSGGYQMVLDTTPAEYQVKKQKVARAVFTVTEAAQGYIHCASGKQLVGWGYDADASQWHMKKAESIEIALTACDGASYASAYLPFPVTLGGDVEAYAIVGTKDVNGDTYATTQKIGREVPAGTPVILISESAAASVTAHIGEATATVPGDAWLRGQYIKSFVSVKNGEVDQNTAAADNFVTPGTDYVLQIKDGRIGFYRLSATGNLAANRAYIPGAKIAGEGIRGIILGGDTATGVDMVDFTPAQGAPAYDLSGRRVKQAGKGIFIVNGKKVIK